MSAVKPLDVVGDLRWTGPFGTICRGCPDLACRALSNMGENMSAIVQAGDGPKRKSGSRSGRDAGGVNVRALREAVSRSVIELDGDVPAIAARHGVSKGYVEHLLQVDEQLFEAMRTHRRKRIATEGVDIAYRTLRDVMADREQKASARVRASEVVLKWAGELGDDAKPGKPGVSGGKPVSEMTASELEDVVRRLEAATRQPQTIDITPGSGGDALSMEDSAETGDGVA